MSYEPSWPHGWPHAWGGSDGSAAPGTVWADFILRIGPPWLRRPWARKILSAIASPLDTIDVELVAAVWARFPQWSVPDALILLGRDRRIRRGPTEVGHVYAPRLVRWLDAHEGRGGAYELLSQLRAFWAGTHDGTHVALSQGGVMHVSVGDDITREKITGDWNGDGSTRWAQVWVMLHLDADPRPVSDVDEEAHRAVPVDWSAEHVWRTHVVLLWGFGRLWSYPDPTLTWATWDDRDADLASMTWDEWDDGMPITITHEVS